MGRREILNATQIRDNFLKFVKTVRDAGQSPDFYFVSIKPSPKRMKRWPMMRKANKLMAALASHERHIHYVDVATMMFDKQGHVRKELFREDGLHMNPRGYALWTAKIQPLLQSQVGPNPLYL